MVVLICVLLAAGAVGFTLLVRERDIPPAPIENPKLKHLQARRAVLYENLKDLQFDYHQGKLSEQDYQSLKQGFLYDLAGLMDSIERLELRKEKPATTTGAKPHAKEKPRTAQPTAGRQTIACPACAASNPAANRFCGHCGQPLH